MNKDRGISMRDLFWGVVISSFMIANGLILNQKSAEVKALRLENQKMATDIQRLNKYACEDFSELYNIRTDVTNLKSNVKKLEFKAADFRAESMQDYYSIAALNQRVDRLSRYSGDDYLSIGNLKREVKKLQGVLESSFRILSGDLGQVENKVGKLEKNSLDDFLDIWSLKEKTQKLQAQQDIENAVLQGDVSDLKKELRLCEEFVVNAGIEIFDSLSNMAMTAANNVASQSTANSTTDLKLSPEMEQEIYNADLSNSGCKGKFPSYQKLSGCTLSDPSRFMKPSVY